MRPSLTSYFHSAGLQAEAIARQISRGEYAERFWTVDARFWDCLCGADGR